MTITIADGRGALWQWDTGRRVKVDGGVKQVHYQNRCFCNTIDVDVGTDGTAIIPDELLQDWHPITVYAYTTDGTGGYTEVQQVLPVHKRAKPADYVYTPTEQKTLADMQRQIGDLSGLETEAKDNLVAAINEAAESGGSGGTSDHSKLKNRDAADQHPMSAITGLTNALAGKQATGESVLIAEQTLTDAQKAQARNNIDAVNAKEALAAHTFTINLNNTTGLCDHSAAEIIKAVNAGKTIMENGLTYTYGGNISSYVVYLLQEMSSLARYGKVMIVQIGDLSGKNPYAFTMTYTPIGLPDLTGATVGQIAKITAVDTDGKPTAWEPVDMPSGGGENWELLRHILIPEGAAETNALTIDTDENGNAFSCKKIRLMSSFPKYTGETTVPNFSFTMVNGFASGSQSPLCYTSGLPTPNKSNSPTGILQIDLSMQDYEIDSVARWAGAGGLPSFVQHYGARRLNGAEAVTSIGGTGMLIYPGCEFYVYGVRA